MLRWLGFLAVVAGAVLVALLVMRTRSGEISGIVRRTRAELRAKVIGEPPLPGRRPVQIDSEPPDSSSDDFVDGLVIAGFSFSASGSRNEEAGTSSWTWEFQMPDEVVATVEPGDVAVIHGRELHLPFGDAVELKYVRYHFRRGTETWSFGEDSNGRFFLAYALAGGGPLLLWGIAWGVTQLCVLSRKPRLRD